MFNQWTSTKNDNICIYDGRTMRCKKLRKKRRFLIAPPAPPEWTEIGQEGGAFFLEQVDLAFGTTPYQINGTYTYVYNVSGNIAFDSNTFGDDPTPEVLKKVFYRSYVPLKQESIPTVFNTGHLGIYSFGRNTADPHYILTSSTQPVQLHPTLGYSALTTPTPAIIRWATGFSGLAGDTQWIGFGDEAGFDRGFVIPNNNRYETTFDLTGYDPKTASLKLQFQVFYYLQDVFLNGKSQGITLNEGHISFSSPFTIDNGFKNGINTLAFLVRNINQFWANTAVSAIRARVSGRAVPYKLGRNIPTLFNTGEGLEVGDIDPHYILTSSANPITLPTPATVTFDDFRWLYNDTDSKWIGWGGSNVAIGSYSVRTEFNLTGFVPNTTVLSLEILVDNRLDDVLLNGVSQGFTILDGSVPNLRTPYTFTQFEINGGSTFLSGINTLDFLWTNLALSRTGIRIRVSGTGIPI